MEASRSDIDELPFEQRPSVRAIDDRIVIESLTVTDERAASVVRERHEAGTPAPETVAKVIEIGARVIDSESVATNVEYVQRAFDERMGKIAAELEQRLEAGSEEIAGQISESFDVGRSDSVQGQIKQMRVAATQQQQQELLKMFSSEEGDNPLVAVQMRTANAMREADERHRQEIVELRESHDSKARALTESHTVESRRMQKQISDLNERLTKLLERQEGEQAVAEAEEAGTRKGFSFEERVFAAVERIADARGDSATHTGAEGAEGGGKKGDVLVEIGAAAGAADGRVVFEAKDRRLSKNEAWDELNAAMAARAAGFGVLVVAGEDRVPAGREQLHEYEGNKLIVAVDRDEPETLALAVAYRLAAARMAMARGRELSVDAAEVRAVAEEAKSTLKQAQSIRSTLTGIKTSSEKARVALDEMVAATEGKLGRIDALVAEQNDAAE